MVNFRTFGQIVGVGDKTLEGVSYIAVLSGLNLNWLP